LTEFIEKVSREFGFFSSQQRRGFVEDVFEACPIPPIVVVSMELECNQEVLEAVIIKCKILSCEKSLKRGRQPTGIDFGYFVPLAFMPCSLARAS
jgi:hypothetical protein